MSSWHHNWITTCISSSWLCYSKPYVSYPWTTGLRSLWQIVQLWQNGRAGLGSWNHWIWQMTTACTTYICRYFGCWSNSDAERFRLLLGGNSLLLGKLSYHPRRKLGVSIGVMELFSKSTIQGIATLIEEKSRSEMDYGTDDDTKHTANFSMALDHDFEHDLDHHRKRWGWSQVCPLCLTVQAIPFLIFFPFKTAFTYGFTFSVANSCLINKNELGSWFLVLQKVAFGSSWGHCLWPSLLLVWLLIPFAPSPLSSSNEVLIRCKHFVTTRWLVSSNHGHNR